MVPYLAWLIFAATLNATIQGLNPGAGLRCSVEPQLLGIGVPAEGGGIGREVLSPAPKGRCAMQSENKMFDDFVKMVNGFAGTMAGMGREAESSAREKMREWMAGADFVGRDEFEAVKAMAAAARDENEALKARIAALEAKAGAAAPSVRRSASRERNPERGRNPGGARRRRPDRSARAIFRGARLGVRAHRRRRDRRFGDRQLGAI